MKVILKLKDLLWQSVTYYYFTLKTHKVNGRDKSTDTLANGEAEGARTIYEATTGLIRGRVALTAGRDRGRGREWTSPSEGGRELIARPHPPPRSRQSPCLFLITAR